MATSPSSSKRRPTVIYPTSDGKPVAETPTHRDNLLGLIDVLRAHYADDPTIYVSGNMFVYYVEGDKRRHVSPDVFLVRGIDDSRRRRDAYFVWEEARGPELVVEFTSKSTRKEDIKDKLALYRDTLGVLEYFLFDPFEEYLKPSIQGFRRVGDEFEPIEGRLGRLPSEVTGMHMERSGWELRVYNPATGRWLPTRDERAEAAERHAQAEKEKAEIAEQRAELERQRAELERRHAETMDQVAREAIRQAVFERLRWAEERAELLREVKALRAGRGGE